MSIITKETKTFLPRSVSGNLYQIMIPSLAMFKVSREKKKRGQKAHAFFVLSFASVTKASL